MFDRLKILYELQNLDDQLDELEELRGDLPNAVKALEEKLSGYKNEISAKEKEKKDSLEKRKENEESIEVLKENQKKFKAQLYQVRNNKEYDALTKENEESIEVLKEIIRKSRFQNLRLKTMLLPI